MTFSTFSSQEGGQGPPKKAKVAKAPEKTYTESLRIENRIAWQGSAGGYVDGERGFLVTGSTCQEALRGREDMLQTHAAFVGQYWSMIAGRKG